MTPQHPQFKEYHHSDNEFDNLKKELNKQRNRLFKILPSGKCDNNCDECILCDNTGGCILSSHSNTPTRNIPQCLCETCQMTVEQCRGAQLRKVSCNDSDVLELLNRVSKNLHDVCTEADDESHWYLMADVDDMIEQLRQQQAQEMMR